MNLEKIGIFTLQTAVFLFGATLEGKGRGVFLQRFLQNIAPMIACLVNMSVDAHSIMDLFTKKWGKFSPTICLKALPR